MLVRSLVGLYALGVFATPAHAEIDFNRDVRAILADNCVRCHGPDPHVRKGKLRLDTKDGLFAKRSDGAIIVPGKPEQSLLIERITAAEPSDRMPPPDSKLSLDAGEIEILRRWIAEGAKWEEHWAFVTPGEIESPATASDDWCRTPVDGFILQRLKAEGLAPTPEADRRTLIRRVTLDLTGLPPTPEEVEAFLNDGQPGAYERVVDRLLGSVRYGERMALAWMDAARYGDSSVHHADGPRFMWPWRDWVIDAYNSNMPFDQFTVEQLAGDLLPNATIAQKVASGFNRNHGTTDEGGAIDEEYRVEYIVDRVKTTSTVWLGLTMECAQCHDHKYDPISQKEYYQFYAYFNRSADRGMQTRNGNAPPLVRVLDDERRKQIDEANTKKAELEKRRETIKPEEAEIREWIATSRSEANVEPKWGPWLVVGPFPAANAGEAFSKNFGPEPLPDFAASYGDKKWSEDKKFKEGAPYNLSIGQNSAYYFARTVNSPAARSIGLSLGSDDGLQVWANGESVLSNNTSRGVQAGQDSVAVKLKKGDNVLLFKVNNQGGPSGFYYKAGESLPDAIGKLLAADKLDDESLKSLRAYYADKVWTGRAEINREIEALAKTAKDLENGAPTSMVLADMKSPRMTYILERGHYDSPRKDEVIEPGVPDCLPALPESSPPNRLGLARWIVDPQHPLTARVTINRYWQLLFGTGLVSTMVDFGTRGDAPSHAELLDYLARDFVDSGWDVKRMIKMLVTSATYRQSSNVSDTLVERDLPNRLLARGVRRRLQGEFIRDQALAVSGLLNGVVGGPSTKPYQPPGIWNEVSLNGGLRYQRDSGDKLYRRGMYIYWKRSAPSPSMRIFDAPTREKCVIERQLTNTPLQALVTLNDIQFVEAARAFAGRVLSRSGEFATRLNYAFLLATARPADDVRHRALGRLYESQLATFRAHPERATELLGFGESKRDEKFDAAEHAAWTMVTSAILNLDEVLTKE